MEFRVLGPVELWSQGHRHDLGSVKARCVLAVLLLNVGAVVPAEVLIERVWDLNPPAKARESLSVYLTRLRRALRQVADCSAKLAARAHGYTLDIDPGIVDLYRFRHLCRQASGLVRSGDRDRAVALLREADELWRGEPLAGLPGDAMARMRRSLEEERRAAIAERVGLELALGRHADLVGELQRLSDQYWMDESFVALQMTALYRAGRQSDALAVYREIRERLTSEQGTEPGPALSELHQLILRGDQALAAVPTSEYRGTLVTSDTLPPRASEFVGREEETSLLTADGGTPLLTVITGMPGVGKTALAVEAAHMMMERFADVGLFISFRSHSSDTPLGPAGALHALLRMLGVPAEHIPLALAERAALWRGELSRSKPLVVVLDDVASAEQVRPLLPTMGNVRILITSRSSLHGLAGAVPLVLGPLPADDGAEMFSRVAGPARAGDPAVVAEIVQLCGGLPLAIQLVASRLQKGQPATLAALLEELSQSPAAFTSPEVAGGEVRAAFESSYRALTSDAQRCFRRLGLHPGTDITVHAAAALDGGSLAETEEALTVLTDHQLLLHSAQIYGFHDLVRRYARTCSAQEDSAPDRRLAFDRLLGYYLYTAERAAQLLYPLVRRGLTLPIRPPLVIPAVETPQSAAKWMEMEWRNVLHVARQASERERKQHSVVLVQAVAPWLEAAGHWEDAADAHALALQDCHDLGETPGVAQESLELSLVANKTGHGAEALRHAETAAATFQSVADNDGRASALDQIGTVHQQSGRFREALAYHQEAREVYQAAGDLRGVASTLNRSGISCCHLGRYRTAMDHFHAALDLYRRTNDRRGEARTINSIGNMYYYQGYHRDALDNYRSALEIFKEIGGEQNQAILYHNIGCIQRYKSRYSESLTSYRQAVSIYRRIGDLPGEAAVLADMGETFHAQGAYREALDHHRRAEEMAWELGGSFERVVALRGIGAAHHGLGKHDSALDYYRKALQLAREIGEPYQEGKVLDGMAETTLQAQGPEAARIYWHQAHDLFDQLGVPEAAIVRLRLENLFPEPPARPHD